LALKNPSSFGEGLAAFVDSFSLRSSASPTRKGDKDDKNEAEANGRGKHVAPTLTRPSQSVNLFHWIYLHIPPCGGPRLSDPNDPKEAAKRLVGYAAVDRYVQDGMCVGLGTGTTAYWAIKRTGERIAAGEKLEAVPTSAATEALCLEFGIPVVPFLMRELDVAIDGADEVAPDFSLTKGGGGALFREKAIAFAARQFIVIVDDSKLVKVLGAFPTPVEVVPFTLAWVTRKIGERYPNAVIRERIRDGVSYRTDNGNAILDCAFGAITDPRSLATEIKAIHGVLDVGIFFDVAAAVLCTSPGGVRELERA
jgi:ribose 5-phosphate isomerase A